MFRVSVVHKLSYQDNQISYAGCICMKGCKYKYIFISLNTFMLYITTLGLF